MGATAKFLFDTDFGRPAPPADPAPPPETMLLSEHAAILARAEAAAFARGVADGRRQAGEEDAARLAAGMARLAEGLADAAQRFDSMGLSSERQAATLAVALSRKLARGLIARHPAASVESLARAVFAELRATPHAVVRVSSDLVDAVKPRLDAAAREAGFAGAIVILGEPDMLPGDARIDWADGGVSLDTPALEAALDDAVRRHLDRNEAKETMP